MATYRGHIVIDDAMLIIADSSDDFDFDLPPLPGNGFGLIACEPGIVVLRTGIISGPIGVEIRVLTESPPVTPGWDDVEEMTVHAFSSAWSATDINLGLAPGFDSIHLAGAPGPMRVRAYSTGRDAYLQEVVETECEQYLLEIWPTTAGIAPIVLRRTSVIPAETAAGTWSNDDTADAEPTAPQGDHSISGPVVSVSALSATQDATTNDDDDLHGHPWGDHPPSDALATVGGFSVGLVVLDRGLADAFVNADENLRRRIAREAARSACAFAGLIDVEWIADGLRAIDVDYRSAFDVFGAPYSSAMTLAQHSDIERTFVSSPHADGSLVDQQLMAVWAASSCGLDNDLQAVIDAVYCAALTHGPRYQPVLDDAWAIINEN